MATIHRDGDLDLLDGKVAVVGFGSQGHAHALNLHDSGVDVHVGLREDSKSRAAAEEAGLKVGTVAEAVKGAQVVAILVPDHLQKEVWDADIAPNLSEGAAVLFAHGLNIHFGRIEPPAGHDVIMVAPKAPGHRVRELYEVGAGTPGLVAVHQDASGRALPLALAYGTAIGCGRVGPRAAAGARVRHGDRLRARRAPRDDLRGGDGERSLRRAGRAVRRRDRADEGGLRDARRSGLPAGDRLLRVHQRAEADRRPDL